MSYSDEILRAIEAQDFEAALGLIERSEAQHGHEAAFIGLKSFLCISAGELEAAAGILSGGVRRYPNDADLLYNYGYVLEALGRDALETYNAYREAYLASNDAGLKRELKAKCATIAETLGSRRKVSIIVLTYNNFDYNKLCIESIRKYTRPGTYELIVVDNASSDETPKWLVEQHGLRAILNRNNVGFPAGCNTGMKAADPNNDILLLNNDTIVTPNWLEVLKTCLYALPETGAVCPSTNSASNHQAVIINKNELDDLNNLEAFGAARNISNSALWDERHRLIAYSLLIKNEAFRKVGLLDERFSPGNYEDDDYCMRLRMAGYRLFLCCDAFIYHFGSTSFMDSAYTALLQTNRNKFTKKWGVDPHLYLINPNLEMLLFKGGPPLKRVIQINCGGGRELVQIHQAHPDVYIRGISETPEALIGDIAQRLNIVAGEAYSVLCEMGEAFDGAVIRADEINSETLNKIILLLLERGGKRLVVHAKRPLNPDNELSGTLPPECQVTETSDVNGHFLTIDCYTTPLLKIY